MGRLQEVAEYIAHWEYPVALEWGCLANAQLHQEQHSAEAHELWSTLRFLEHKKKKNVFTKYFGIFTNL